MLDLVCSAEKSIATRCSGPRSRRQTRQLRRVLTFCRQSVWSPSTGPGESMFLTGLVQRSSINVSRETFLGGRIRDRLGTTDDSRRYPCPDKVGGRLAASRRMKLSSQQGCIGCTLGSDVSSPMFAEVSPGRARDTGPFRLILLTCFRQYQPPLGPTKRWR